MSDYTPTTDDLLALREDLICELAEAEESREDGRRECGHLWTVEAEERATAKIVEARRTLATVEREIAEEARAEDAS